MAGNGKWEILRNPRWSAPPAPPSGSGGSHVNDVIKEVGYALKSRWGGFKSDRRSRVSHRVTGVSRGLISC